MIDVTGNDCELRPVDVLKSLGFDVTQPSMYMNSQPNVVVGLNNFGNTCYFNAVVQLIYSFKHDKLWGMEPEDWNESKKQFKSCLDQLFREMDSCTEIDVISPYDAFAAYVQMKGSIKNSAQQNATEAFNTIRDACGMVVTRSDVVHEFAGIDANFTLGMITVSTVMPFGADSVYRDEEVWMNELLSTNMIQFTRIEDVVPIEIKYGAEGNEFIAIDGMYKGAVQVNLDATLFLCPDETNALEYRLVGCVRWGFVVFAEN